MGILRARIALLSLNLFFPFAQQLYLNFQCVLMSLSYQRGILNSQSSVKYLLHLSTALFIHAFHQQYPKKLKSSFINRLIFFTGILLTLELQAAAEKNTLFSYLLLFSPSVNNPPTPFFFFSPLTAV